MKNCRLRWKMKREKSLMSKKVVSYEWRGASNDEKGGAWRGFQFNCLGVIDKAKTAA
jgi:hypothetical protein